MTAITGDWQQEIAPPATSTATTPTTTTATWRTLVAAQ